MKVNGTAVIFYADLGSDEREKAVQLADKERLAEDLRLLYVAITRAKYRCYFSWGQFAGAENSGLAWLLHQGHDESTGQTICNMATLGDGAIRNDLSKINGDDTNYLSIEDLPIRGGHFSALTKKNEVPLPIAFKGNAEQSWRMTSFSGMTMGATHWKEYHVELPEHDMGIDDASHELAQSFALSRFNFPRGAQAGLFLHHLFENIHFANVNEEVLSAVVLRSLQQYGIEDKWQKVVIDWVGDILDTALNNDGNLMLRNISSHKRLVEMEFHFPLQDLNAGRINALLTRSRKQDRRTPTLNFSTLSGMMKGFIDLIFEHDDRFYVLDYKSNHMGNTFDDYRCDALEKVIDGHYYDLQYLIYTLALHRYLKTRLPGYDYDQHFGGVYYLFLRGMTPQKGNSAGIYYDKPPVNLICSLDQLLSGEREKVACD